MNQIRKSEHQVDISMESTPFREYYDSYEKIVFFSSFRWSDHKYLYRPTLIASVKKCIDVLSIEQNRKLVQNHVFSKLRHDFKRGSSSLQRLMEEDDECVSYLGLTGKSDLKDLKKKYRQACMKYHPDRGGDEEKIKAINGCYPVFFQILADKSMDDQLETTNSFGVVKLYKVVDFCSFLNFKLLELLIAEDDISGAKSQLGIIETNGTLEANTFKTARFKHHGNFINNPIHSSFYDCLMRLGGRLCVLGENQYTQYLLDSHIKDMEYRLRFLSREWLTRERDKLEEKVEGKKKEKIVVIRLRNAQNLYEQGLINLTRFNKVTKRIETQETDRLVFRGEFDNWILSNNFVQLSDYKKYTYSPKNDETVPVPSIFEQRLEQLTPRQINEYMKAFYHSPSYDLVSIYLEVRVSSVIFDLFDLQSSDFLESLCAEFTFLARVTVGGRLTDFVVSFIELLLDADYDNRKKLLGSRKNAKKIINMSGPMTYLGRKLDKKRSVAHFLSSHS